MWERLERNSYSPVLYLAVFLKLECVILCDKGTVYPLKNPPLLDEPELCDRPAQDMSGIPILPRFMKPKKKVNYNVASVWCIR